MLAPIDAADLREIVTHAGSSMPFLAGKNIFLTGGTGFFGKWLIQALLEMEPYRSNQNQITILSRNGREQARTLPWLAHPAVRLIDGDVRSFAFPADRYEIVIHAAVPASAALIKNDPAEMLDTNIAGARHVLNFARECGAETFMLTSSGAVYGRQPLDMRNVSETYNGAPSPVDVGASYAEGKRCAELMSVISGAQSGMQVKIARCFGYVAPYLPLDTHFAVGNFMLNCLRNEDIHIRSDGSSFRSYMYGTDLITWLIRILTHGESGRPYNVGAEDPISIGDLARLVQRIATEELPHLADRRVLVAEKPIPGKLGERYVPSVERAIEELGLKITVSREEAIRRTLRWHLKTQ